MAECLGERRGVEGRAEGSVGGRIWEENTQGEVGGEKTGEESGRVLEELGDIWTVYGDSWVVGEGWLVGS